MFLKISELIQHFLITDPKGEKKRLINKYRRKTSFASIVRQNLSIKSLESELLELMDKKQINQASLTQSESIVVPTATAEDKYLKPIANQSLEASSINVDMPAVAESNAKKINISLFARNQSKSSNNITMRFISPRLPTWGGEIEMESSCSDCIQCLEITNTCTIDYILIGFWISSKLSAPIRYLMNKDSNNNELENAIVTCAYF